MDLGPNKPNDRLVEAFRGHIDAYIAREVLPHVPDAWVDYSKTKVGYEIPLNRHFLCPIKPPRPLDQIEGGHHQVGRRNRRAAEGTGGMSDDIEQQWFARSTIRLDRETRRLSLQFPSGKPSIPSVSVDDLVAHYSIPQVQETGGPLIEPASDINSN